MSDAAVDDRMLHLERLIAAPPERVFAYFTQPELLIRWWGPEGYDIPKHDLDIRPGGRWRTTMRSPEGTLHSVSGTYRTVEPPRLLVFTWGWHDQDSDARGHETEVTVTFDPAPGGTRLVLRQQIFETATSRDLHRQGWVSSLNDLARVVT